jgi:hypothetical protein
MGNLCFSLQKLYSILQNLPQGLHILYLKSLGAENTDASSLEKVLTGYLKRLKVLHRVIKEDRFSSSQTR